MNNDYADLQYLILNSHRPAKAIKMSISDVLNLFERLSSSDRSLFINHDQTFTDLYLACQKFNYLVIHPPLLFRELKLTSQILPIKELTPVNAFEPNIQKISSISDNQMPFTKLNLFNKKTYYYSEKESLISHHKEGGSIFYNTQKERLKAFIGHLAKKFNKKSQLFHDNFFFRHDENLLAEIYPNEQPIENSNLPTSYWLGHASCFISLPIHTHQKLTIVTDPVEGNLNTFLVRRMTKPARLLENAPLPQIFLLSHNHLDHFQKNSLKKLITFQPIVIAPLGNKKRLSKIGFKHIYECNWWETLSIPLQIKNVKYECKITTVPANHWSGQNPFEFYESLFMGFILHTDLGDIYYAGDTARLSDEHILTLLTKFNIVAMFQPGGPDELRDDMKSTHQASVDAIWMHVKLILKNLYLKQNFDCRSKHEFMQKAIDLRTVFMHLKTYKLGNVHFDDTERGIQHMLEQLKQNRPLETCQNYERELFHELSDLLKDFTFSDQLKLETSDLAKIIEKTLIIPKIGSRTVLINSH